MEMQVVRASLSEGICEQPRQPGGRCRERLGFRLSVPQRNELRTASSFLERGPWSLKDSTRSAIERYLAPVAVFRLAEVNRLVRNADLVQLQRINLAQPH